ncbi:uncharacterized protein MELLADRAFT_112746 [Melampsora larici-populina 98AG31]|uniref:Uncharacterized protein n=1 Tax=Melampsora larici-populina (strain 98AG31 / pathotype 3-4-7) TaxID=747676 RepID=F4S7G3_MELLP|nr:uncharacterized protein MELLADRAFT_112746 [Melampsora larici-populina 98AG31]EGF99430.1 hypothetical protein MELLADRAFT_112746 [Melampsora larici-populina 98AG31]
MTHGDIMANSFIFCAEHGQEVCHRCCVDHRLCDTVSIEKELAALLEATGDEPDIDADDRPSFNLFAYTLFPLGDPWDPDDDIPCCEHTEADCKICFDWVKIVGNDI